MGPVLITLIVIVVLLIVTGLITYFVRNNYYKQIDELDQQKSKVLEKAPYDELKEVADLNITGQSLKIRKDLENQWHNIEAVKYPKLENHLYEAEQATDRYRLGESKNNQEKAEKAIKEIEEEIASLRDSLKELIEREQANLEKIDAIKKRYHEVRKSLLAYSFSFGPASESFERNLNSMEEDFTEFSEATVSGDHEEAKEIVHRLSKKIKETEDQMDQVPPLLETINEVHAEELEDLQQGYEEMSDEGFLFPNDTILEDIEGLEEDKKEILEDIRVLNLKEAETKTEQLSEEIEKLYQTMEVEIETQPQVKELLQDIKRALYYLQDENRRLQGGVNRLSQSYVLLHNEPAIIERLEEQVKTARTHFDELNQKVSEQKMPYTTAYTELDRLFVHLEDLHGEYDKIANYLDDYRQEELRLKNELHQMEQDLYEMKRHLENERLPGLPDDYLELFFSTSDRLEDLAKELSRPKIQLTDIQKVHQMCKEDVRQLEGMTTEIIRQVELTELVSQRLYRYRESHKGILETIRYSESLFSEDYDYDTALRLVREKLENVAPGAYEEVLEEYENKEQTNE